MTHENTAICFLINHLESGGAQSLIQHVVRASSADIDHTVCYFGDDELATDLEADGATVVGFDANTRIPQFDPRAVWSMWNYFSRKRFDVIHAHLPFSQVLGRLAGQRNDTPVVSTQHSIPSNYHPLERALERGTRRLDDATVFVSRAVREAFGVEETTRPIRTIYNGIDAEGFNQAVASADGESLRESLTSGDVGPVYLNVGRCREMKRQVDVVRAMTDVVEREPDAHLVVAGDGPQLPNLQTEVTRLDLADNVTLTGRVPKAEIHRYYAFADAYVLSSEYEGMPITLLEAMAAELPIVATDAPGVAEFVTDGETGVVVPPKTPSALAEAMLDVRSTEMRERLGKNAYEVVTDRYDVEETAAAYLELYTSCLVDQ